MYITPPWQYSPITHTQEREEQRKSTFWLFLCYCCCLAFLTSRFPRRLADKGKVALPSTKLVLLWGSLFRRCSAGGAGAGAAEGTRSSLGERHAPRTKRKSDADAEKKHCHNFFFSLLCLFLPACSVDTEVYVRCTCLFAFR
jgi:hypothetical protein